MKKKAIILLFSIMPFLQSCKDSLGIDPSVQIIPAGSGSEIGDSSPYMFKIDTLIFKDITEKFIIYNSPSPDIWINYPMSAEIYLDTTKSNYKIWMTINLSSPNNGQSVTTKRKDWISSINLKFRAIMTLNQDYMFTYQAGSWNNINLYVDSVVNNNIISLEYKASQFNSNIRFTNIDKKNGIIYGSLSAEFMPDSKLETKSLFGSFYFKYRK